MAEKIATREAYGSALAEFGDKYDKLVVLDADLAEATKTIKFKKKFPDRFFDCVGGLHYGHAGDRAHCGEVFEALVGGAVLTD